MLTCSSKIDGSGNVADAGGEILFNLKVPETQDCPPAGGKCAVRESVAFLCAPDLVVPVMARLSKGEVVWVSVPEGAVNKHCYAGSSECNVRLAGNRLWVAPPPAYSCGIESSS